MEPTNPDTSAAPDSETPIGDAIEAAETTVVSAAEFDRINTELDAPAQVIDALTNVAKPQHPGDDTEAVTVYADAGNTVLPTSGVGIVSAVYSEPPPAPTATVSGNAISLNIPEHLWVETEPGDLTHLALAGGLAINGASLHLEAIQVEQGDTQTAVDPAYEDEVNAIYAISGGNGKLVAAVIGGRDYLLVATPYED